MATETLTDCRDALAARIGELDAQVTAARAAYEQALVAGASNLETRRKLQKAESDLADAKIDLQVLERHARAEAQAAWNRQQAQGEIDEARAQLKAVADAEKATHRALAAFGELEAAIRELLALTGAIGLDDLSLRLALFSELEPAFVHGRVQGVLDLGSGSLMSAHRHNLERTVADKAAGRRRELERHISKLEQSLESPPPKAA